MIQRLFLLTAITVFLGCREDKLYYPEIIVNNDLQALYDKSIVDWHILNSIDGHSKSLYLLRLDTFVENRIYVKDSLRGVWSIDRDMINNKEEMIRRFPNHIIDFLDVDLELFQTEQFSILHGDTVVLTLFPVMRGYRDDMLYDPIDGYVHTLYYLGSEIIRVGQNDYIEFEWLKKKCN